MMRGKGEFNTGSISYNTYGGVSYPSSNFNRDTHIGTITLKYANLLAIYGVKLFKDIEYIYRRQNLLSVQLRLNKKMALGGMYNYIPDTLSGYLQIFF